MVGLNVNANAQLGHVGIVEYSKILIFEILNYTTYHYAPYVNRPQREPQSFSQRTIVKRFMKFLQRVTSQGDQ